MAIKVVNEMSNQNPNANGLVKVLKSSEVNEFISSNKYAIIDFYATWCPPCKLMEPITNELAEMYQGKIAFGKINTDQERPAAQLYQIRYVPTFYLFANGKITNYFSGAKRKNDFVEIINKYFKN